MVSLDPNSKYLTLDDVRVFYDHKSDVIRLTSSDPDLDGEFSVTLKESTPTSIKLRSLLVENGLVKHPEFPTAVQHDVSKEILDSFDGGIYMVSGDSGSRGMAAAFVNNLIASAASLRIPAYSLDSHRDFGGEIKSVIDAVSRVPRALVTIRADVADGYLRSGGRSDVAIRRFHELLRLRSFEGISIVIETREAPHLVRSFLANDILGNPSIPFLDNIAAFSSSMDGYHSSVHEALGLSGSVKDFTAALNSMNGFYYVTRRFGGLVMGHSPEMERSVVR